MSESILDRQASSPDAVLSYASDPDQIGDLRIGHDAFARPLLILIHGGFWKPEYNRLHLSPLAAMLAESGWSVLNLEYRRKPGDPDATFHDIATALASLPARIEQHNRSFVVIGHSAGGHLALWAAVNCDSPAFRTAIALAPVADLGVADSLNLGNGAVRKFLGVAPVERPDADPVRLGTPTMAVLLLHGVEDDVVPIALSESYHHAFPTTRLSRIDDVEHYALIDTVGPAHELLLSILHGLAS